MNIRKKDKIRDLLSRSDRGVGHHSGISGVLAKLFQSIMGDKGMTIPQWNYLINEYAKKEVKHQDNRRDLASIRGNLNKEFTRGRMSWKVFCKAMMFLQIRRFKLIVVAEWEDGTTTQHSTIVESATVLERPRDLNIPQPVPRALTPQTPKTKAEEVDKVIDDLVKNDILLIDRQKQ